jgi:hypothetical protein
MRYTIPNKTVVEMAENIKAIANPDSKVVLSLGNKVQGDVIASQIRVTTSAEQLMYQFGSPKPEGFEKGQEITLDATTFSGAVESLASFNSDVYIDVNDAVVYVGVDGKAQVPVELVGQSPDALAAEPSMYTCQMKGEKVISFIRRGSMLAADKPTENGIENAAWIIEPSTGKVKGLSTDGFIIGKTESCFKLPNREGFNEQQKAVVEKQDALLKEYLEKSGTEFIVIKAPKKAAAHLSSLISGEKFKEMLLTFSITEHQVLIRIGNSLVFSFVQGVRTALSNPFYEQLLERDDGLGVQIDNEQFINCIEFLNKAYDLQSAKNQFKPIVVSVADNKVNLSGGKSGMLKTNCPYSSVSGNPQDITFSGTALQKMLKGLDHSNIVMRMVTAKPDDDKYGFIIFRNGSLDEVSEDRTVIGRPVMTMGDSSADEETSEN